MEGVGDVRVHVDVEVAVLLDLGVALLDAGPHPAGEDAAQHRGAHVRQPLLGDLPDLLLVRHVREDVLVPVVQEVAHVTERQALVLRDREVAHVFCLDAYSKAMRTELTGMALTFLPGGHQVLQEVDGDLLVRGQVVRDVDAEEVVHLALAPEGRTDG